MNLEPGQHPSVTFTFTNWPVGALICICCPATTPSGTVIVKIVGAAAAGGGATGCGGGAEGYGKEAELGGASAAGGGTIG